MFSTSLKRRWSSLSRVNQRNFSTSSNKVELFGHKVPSVKEENAKDVVFLHALLCQSRHWRSFSIHNVFSERAHCHLVDLRNHGESDQSSEMSYSSMAEDVLRYADRANLETFDVVGHAMGGKLAMILACKYPERINSVISLDSLPLDHNKTDPNILATNIKALDNLLSLDIEGKTRKSVIDMLNDEFEDKGIATLVAMNVIYDGDQSNTVKWCTNIKAIRDNIEKLIGFEDHGKCKRPYLGIYGEASAKLIQKANSQGRSDFTETSFGFSEDETCVKIENGGHWMHLERLAEVTNHVAKFYARIDQ